jgi:hypothetical protein
LTYFLTSTLTVGPDGNFWDGEASVSDFPFPGESGLNTGSIGRITPSGALTSFPLPPGTGNPGSLTVGPDGNLWFGTGVGIGRADLAPRVTKVVAIANSRGAITSILLGFDEALNPSSASKGRLYGLAAGVERRQTIVFSKGVKIARVSYDRTAHAVRLKLAVPQKRPVQVTVHAGLVAADKMSSFSDFRAVVA